jgi:hypothetical protein
MQNPAGSYLNDYNYQAIREPSPMQLTSQQFRSTSDSQFTQGSLSSGNLGFM